MLYFKSRKEGGCFMKKLEKRFVKQPNTVEAYACMCSCSCTCDAYCSAAWEVQQEANYTSNSSAGMRGHRMLPEK